MTTEWIPHDGGPNPVREGETLTELLFDNDCWMAGGSPDGSLINWGYPGPNKITHYRVSPPRVTEPATMSADEVLIRAREAVIEVTKTQDIYRCRVRGGENDHISAIRAIIAYERDRAKPLAEVAPHTVEDADEQIAYKMYVALPSAAWSWAERKNSPSYCAILKAIKRGRELERNVSDKETV